MSKILTDLEDTARLFARVDWPLARVDWPLARVARPLARVARGTLLAMARLFASLARSLARAAGQEGSRIRISPSTMIVAIS